MAYNKMTDEQLRDLARLLRNSAVMIAENKSLISILAFAAQKDTVPKNWAEDLERLRETPAYRAILEVFEPMIAQIEKSGGEIDWIELMRKMPKEILPA